MMTNADLAALRERVRELEAERDYWADVCSDFQIRDNLRTADLAALRSAADAVHPLLWKATGWEWRNKLGDLDPNGTAHAFAFACRSCAVAWPNGDEPPPDHKPDCPVGALAALLPEEGG